MWEAPSSDGPSLDEPLAVLASDCLKISSPYTSTQAVGVWISMDSRDEE